jgi:lysophospholipase L1-like esterase
MDEARDDSLMSRFERHGLRCFRARDAILAVAIAATVLVLLQGSAIRRAGEQMNAGPGRELMLAAGRPAGWIADRLPFERLASHATAWLSPDVPLRPADRFGNATATGRSGVPPVTPDAFDPVELGERAPAKSKLRTVLVTGDSLSTPLDAELAGALVTSGISVFRDPHLGTGISKSFVVDWAQLSAGQVRLHHPDAVVVFIGANEGFPMPGPHGATLRCCTAAWAGAYADRVRRVTATYRQGGAARVYWITVPTPRDPDRRRISRVVNAAIAVAVEPWRAQVRVIDTVPTFTPSGYRDAMDIDGVSTIVREADGIHLNAAGARVLAEIVLAKLRGDFAI